MKICIQGLWHLGVVTATCLANAGHDVIGFDLDSETIDRLNQGLIPISEPGLQEAMQAAIAKEKLHFTSDPKRATDGVDVIWVNFDTPVDDNDQADVEFVVDRVTKIFPFITENSLFIISSQVPVGTTRRLEKMYAESPRAKPVTFSYIPENLQLGKAIEAFTRPTRFVVGVRGIGERPRIEQLLSPFCDRFEWMSVESAEMTKHAINAFLATSVVFINEIAVLCENIGADAKEIERGLKTEVRIGPKAYLAPGSSFAGGTLARDVTFLRDLGREHHVGGNLFQAVLSSNESHRGWVQQRLNAVLGNLTGRTITVWGLSYKVGTDTLRRSSSVQLCQWLAERGASVHAHDPVVAALPEPLTKQVRLYADPLTSLHNAEALIISTGWPVYAGFNPDQFVSATPNLIIFDANRVLPSVFQNDPRLRYFAVGKALL